MSTDGSTAPGTVGETDIDGLLARLRTTVEQARAMPMSSSAVIGRAEVLDLIDGIQAAVTQLKAERATGTGLNATAAEARVAADKILADAEDERRQMLESTSVHTAAQREAERIREEARSEADGLRRDTDEYVDGKLANFEITLNKTLEAVSRGRARLRGRSDLDELGSDDLDAIHLPEH